MRSFLPSKPLLGVVCSAVIVLGVGLMAPEAARADVRTEARQHFRRGMDLVASGDLDRGIAELEIAYDTLPHPNVLYNIARAFAEHDHYEQAIEYFERYLASDPIDRAEVVGYITALQARLGRTAEAQPAPTVEQPATSVEPGVEALRPEDVTPEQILAIRESATQIRALAEATVSENLHARADRLDSLANELERSRAIAEAEAAQTAQNTQTAQTTPAAPEGALQVGGVRTDVFEETVVSASRMAESPLDAPNSTTIITSQDIRMTGITDVAQLLRRAAGVDAITYSPGHTDLAIRGLPTRHANKVLVLVNGRTVRLDFLGSPFLSILPFQAQDIDRIEVIRGPAAAVYGADAFSGIINIILREPGDGSSRLYVGIGSSGFIEADGSFTGRRDRLSYRLGAGYREADNYSRIVSPDRVDVATFDPNTERGVGELYSNGELRLSFGEGNVLHVGSAISRSDTAIMGVGNIHEMNVRDTYFSQTHAQLNTKVGIGARLYWNNLSGEVDNTFAAVGSHDAGSSLRNDIVDIQLDFNRSFHFLVDHNLTLGGGYRLKSAKVNWFGENTIREHHGFLFIQDALTLHRKLRATLNFRADRHPLFGFRFSPRGSLVYRFLEGHSLRFTAGTAFRNPSFLESYLLYTNRASVRAATALGVGNKDLDPEQMLSFELGYQTQTNYFALEANAYYNLVRDQIQLSRVTTFTLDDFASGVAGFDVEADAFPIGATMFQNQPTAFQQVGGELGLRVFPGRGLDVYANYAISDTRPLDPEELTPVRRMDQRTPLHKVNVGLQYRAPFGLDLSADLHVVTKTTWVEPTQVAGTEGLRFAPYSISGYQILNGRIGYRLFDDKLDLGIVGQNLLFQRHRQHPWGQRLDTRVVGQATLRF